MNQLKMSKFQIKVKSPNGVDYIEVKQLMEDYPDFLTMSMAMLVPDMKMKKTWTKMNMNMNMKKID